MQYYIPTGPVQYVLPENNVHQEITETLEHIHQHQQEISNISVVDYVMVQENAIRLLMIVHVMLVVLLASLKVLHPHYVMDWIIQEPTMM